MFLNRGKQRKNDKTKELRDTQIRNLLALNYVTRVANNPNAFIVEYIDNRHGKKTFNIELPHDFPSSPPVIRFLVTARHPWLDQSGQVSGSSLLKAWGIRTDIARVVGEIHKEFTDNPPQLASHGGGPGGGRGYGAPGGVSYPYGGRGVAQPYGGQAQPQPYGGRGVAVPYGGGAGHAQQPPAYGGGVYAPQKPQIQPQISPQPVQKIERPQKKDEEKRGHTPVPPVPSKIDELDGLTVAELESFLADPTKLSDFLTDLPIVTSLFEMRDSIQASVMEAAQSNLEQRETMESLHAELEDLKQQVTLKDEEFQQYKSRQHQILSKYSPLEISRLLDDKIEVAEENTKGIQEQFEDEEINHAKFARQYVKARKIYHLQCARKERLCETHGLPKE